MGLREQGDRAWIEGVHSLDVPRSMKALPPALDKLIRLMLQVILFGVNFGETFGTSLELMEPGVFCEFLNINYELDLH